MIQRKTLIQLCRYLEIIWNELVQRKSELLDFFANKKGKPGQVGVSYSSEKICLAHIIPEKGKPALVFCEDFAAASDEEREEVLRQQVKNRNLEGVATNFVLSTEDYKLFLVEAPKVEPQEMASAIKWKIKDLVDNPVDELAVTLFSVPDDAYRGQNEMVYAVTARKNKIRQVVDQVSRSGLELKAIDIPEMVMQNISSSFSDDSSGLAFIDLRSNGSTLNLCRDGKIYLTRHLNTRVDQDIINSQEWEAVKERLVLEIQRSLDYYESQMGQSPIAKILIAPRAFDTDQLASQLDASMTVPVSALNLASAFGKEDDFSPALQQSCILAIGGAMRNEKAAA